MRKCELCNSRKNVQEHHLFSGSKLNRKFYGDYIDDPRNKKDICEACHLWKPIPKYGELKFCDVMGIFPRTKTGKDQYKRMFPDDNH